MFCPKCGTLMRPKVKDGKLVYVCPSCGYVMENNPGVSSVVTTKVVSNREDVEIKEKSKLPFPVVEATCPKCGNNRAYFQIVQTRAADEPPTRIYTCTKCGYTWREYA